MLVALFVEKKVIFLDNVLKIKKDSIEKVDHVLAVGQ
jgi:hypothetical protein